MSNVGTEIIIAIIVFAIIFSPIGGAILSGIFYIGKGNHHKSKKDDSINN